MTDTNDYAKTNSPPNGNTNDRKEPTVSLYCWAHPFLVSGCMLERC